MFPAAGNLPSHSHNHFSASHQEGSSLVSNSEQNLTQVVWGTNINTNDVQVKFKNFITNFTIDRPEDAADIGSTAHYIRELQIIGETEEAALNVDCEHLYMFDQSLYNQLVLFPSEIIPYFDSVANMLYREYNRESNPDHQI